MTCTDAVEIARLNDSAALLGRMAYRLAGSGQPDAARYVRALRARQYARVRAITAH